MSGGRRRAELLAERERLLRTLRERQDLLERLSLLRREIIDRRPVGEVLGEIVASACELLGDDVGVLRGAAGNGITAAHGLGGRELASAELDRPALGRLAGEDGRAVIVDAISGGEPELLEAEFGDSGVRAGIAAAVHRHGVHGASLAVGSREPLREYRPRDEQSLLALAELAGLALEYASAIADASHEAFHDRITGLPNRALFLDRLEHAVERAGEGGAPVGVLLCDLDGFKTVNDSLGHAVGDLLLAAVGVRLERCVGPSDTVARIGADEFAVLLEGLGKAGDAARAAQRVLDGFDRPFDIGSREIYAGLSIGVATSSADPQALLRDVDLALYRAKREGRGRYALVEPGLHTAIVERLDLEVDLKGALERDELKLVYQPVFDLRAGTVVGLEALARWRHPTRGIVGPDRFIPLAEESGQIVGLGRWVLREACRQAALWRARYPGFTGLQVGVNVSAAQLREPTFVDQVSTALEGAQLDPGGLTLEITETVLMEDVATATTRLETLKGLGVELAIDDFGRAYSSLTHLQRFPLDNLKIDRHFVGAIGDSGDIPELLRAILDLAEIFGLRPIAEGIERREQIECLLALGCGLGQGHLLSEPLGPAEADSLLLRAGLLGAPVSGEGPSPDRPLGSPDAGAADPAGPAAH
ncbi:MAG: putative bifunctional diguanylate cyclase/phosphodiesterase, partial [Solirubrobacterales bacterium]